MITWINYAIYLVISFVNIGMYYLLLTPKKSIIRATTISFIVLLPFTYFKFFFFDEFINRYDSFTH